MIAPLIPSNRDGTDRLEVLFPLAPNLRFHDRGHGRDARSVHTRVEQSCFGSRSSFVPKCRREQMSRVCLHFPFLLLVSLASSCSFPSLGYETRMCCVRLEPPSCTSHLQSLTQSFHRLSAFLCRDD